MSVLLLGEDTIQGRMALWDRFIYEGGTMSDGYTIWTREQGEPWSLYGSTSGRMEAMRYYRGAVEEQEDHLGVVWQVRLDAPTGAISQAFSSDGQHDSVLAN